MKKDYVIIQVCLAGVLGATLFPNCVEAGSASVTTSCRSLSLHEFTGSVSGNTVYVSVTTYDGSNGRPLGLLSNNTFNNCEELRPRAGSPGVYEADYAAYQEGLAAYGYFTINLPTTDSDSNGMPDVSQRSKAVDSAFTGSGGSSYSRDVPAGSFQIKNGRIRRSAGSASGTFSYTSVETAFSINYSGTFSLSTAAGSVDYTRGNPNTMTFTLTIQDGEGTRTATGSTTFNVVSANQITLAAFTLTSSDQRSLAVQQMTLNRAGQRYAGDMTLTDGYPGSAWADYTRWVVEIVDLNDSDADGIPDLSGTVVIPNQLPKVHLSSPLNGASFPAPTTVALSADASDSDGSIAKVEFFDGSVKLQEVATAPYNFSFTAVPLGMHVLTAKATDNRGGVSTSSPVRITVNNDVNKQMLYSTRFEPDEGYSTDIVLDGQNGWVAVGEGLNGILNNVFTGQGAGAFLGYQTTEALQTVLFRPILFTPNSTLPLVRFSVQMSIVDSDNGKYDDFRWCLYNSEGAPLFSLSFYNRDLHVYYRLEEGEYVDTLKKFTNTNVYELRISLDTEANRWEATLDGSLLAGPLPIAATNSLADIGGLAAEWEPTDGSAPGNNFLAFDNYEIWAEAKPSRPILSVPGKPAGGQVMLTLQGTPGKSYTLRRSSDLRTWGDRQTKAADAAGAVLFTEAAPTGQGQWFYSALQNP